MLRIKKNHREKIKQTAEACKFTSSSHEPRPGNMLQLVQTGYMTADSLYHAVTTAS